MLNAMEQIYPDLNLDFDREPHAQPPVDMRSDPEPEDDASVRTTWRTWGPTCQYCASGCWCDDHAWLFVGRARCFLNQIDFLTDNEKEVLHVGDHQPGRHESHLRFIRSLSTGRHKHFDCPSCLTAVCEPRSPTATPEPCKKCTIWAHWNVWDGFSLRRLCYAGPQPGYRWPSWHLTGCAPGLTEAYITLQRTSADRLLPNTGRTADRSRSPRRDHDSESESEPTPVWTRPSPELVVLPEAQGPPYPADPKKYACPMCKRRLSTEHNATCWWCLGQPGWEPDDPAHEFRIGRSIVVNLPGRDGIRLVPGRIL